MSNLYERLKKEERLSLYPYTDTRGFLTIGYGRNLATKGISIEEAEYMLLNDIKKARIAYESHFGYLDLNTSRRNVLTDMIFNLGLTGVLGFKKMIAALEKKDYGKAADEMLNSEWRKQVGDRAVNLARIMRTGVLDDGT